MRQYERIDFSEEIDLSKTSRSKECEICNYNYFSNSFKFDSNVYNDCNRGITAFELKNLAIVNVRGIGHRVFMFDITEVDVHNILGDFQSIEL